MNLIDFINEIKKMMIDFPERYKDNKRDAYRDMEIFAESLSQEEKTIVETNIDYLISATRNKLSGESIVPQKTFELYPKEVAGMYLMLIKTNREQALSINQQQLFLIVQLFGGISYFKYQDILTALLDPRIIKTIDECQTSDYNKLYGVLYDLVDAVEKIESSDIESYIDKFMESKVHYNLYIPDEDKNNNPLFIKFKQNITFLKDTILRAESVNETEYNYFKQRTMILESINSFSIDAISKYLEYDNEILKDGRNRWSRTRADLTLLNIMQHIKIEDISLEEISILVNKLSNLLPDNYQELLSTNTKFL